MDYVLNVCKNKEFLFAIGGKHMNYDNVIWWQLEELIKVIEESNSLNTEELIKDIQGKSVYFTFVMNEPYDNGMVLDIANKTITVDHLQLYDFDDVTKYNCGRELKLIDNKYFVEYDAFDEMLDVDYATFNLELLSKRIMSFEEFKKISSFIHSLLNYDKYDVIINNCKFLLLTEI